MKKHQYGFSYLIQELFKSPNNILKVLMVCIISIFMVFRLFISIPHDVKEYYKIQLPDTHEKYYNHINEILVLIQPNSNDNEIQKVLKAYTFPVPETIKIFVSKDLFLNNKNTLNIQTFTKRIKNIGGN